MMTYWLVRRAFVARLAFFFMTGPVIAQSPIAVSAILVPAQLSAGSGKSGGAKFESLGEDI